MTRITIEPASIVTSIPTLLPNGNQPIVSQAEALAALVHAINTSLSLESLKNEGTQANDENVLPSSWNSRAPEFTLRYRNPNSDSIFLVKLVELGSKTLIHGLIEETDKSTSLEITTSEHVSPSFFSTEPNPEPIIHGFVSLDRLAEFITKYVQVILKPILPDLDYELGESEETPVVVDDQARPPQPRQPQEDSSSRPNIDQPYQLPNADRRPRNPLEIGRDDLDPFPSPFGRGPFGFQPLQPGGGMIVGPGHPAFGGVPAPANRGPWGGDGFLPPLGAPQGARFDPVHPFGPGPRLPGQGRGGIPPRGGYMGGDPDNDEFHPPGFENHHDDMYM